MDMNLSKLWETVEDTRAWHAIVHGVAKSQTRLSDRTATKTDDSTSHEARGGWIPAGGLGLPDGKRLRQGRRLRGAQRI